MVGGQKSIIQSKPLKSTSWSCQARICLPNIFPSTASPLPFPSASSSQWQLMYLFFFLTILFLKNIYYLAAWLVGGGTQNLLSSLWHVGTFSCGIRDLVP